MNDQDQLLLYVGLISIAIGLSVNVVDAAVSAYEKYALKTPEQEDDAHAARARAAIDAVKDFVDTIVGLLRPFKKKP